MRIIELREASSGYRGKQSHLRPMFCLPSDILVWESLADCFSGCIFVSMQVYVLQLLCVRAHGCQSVCLLEVSWRYRLVVRWVWHRIGGIHQ